APSHSILSFTGAETYQMVLPTAIAGEQNTCLAEVPMGQWCQNNAVWALSASQQIAPNGEAAARWKAGWPVNTPMRPYRHRLSGKIGYWHAVAVKRRVIAWEALMARHNVSIHAAFLASSILAWPAMAADVTPERLLNPDREPHNWL